MRKIWPKLVVTIGFAPIASKITSKKNVNCKKWQTTIELTLWLSGEQDYDLLQS